MRRNCNFSLHKLPPNYNASSSSSWSTIANHHFLSCSDPNQIKIFRNDATELQAICILLLARREREQKWKKHDRSSAFLQLQAHGSRGLSFKKSLQKFFQNRKERMQASIPY
ncbi:protein TIFY 5A-like [Salvia miltiorrhiza]|uniref:protein TIFY 5A-like n=1 Tax=Salvia miltiorrhiza TaxID=226208 RepID=UPI0025ACFC09|nr:protein TIFY 5A-like [Salvia miltiorrhiza]